MKFYQVQYSTRDRLIGTQFFVADTQIFFCKTQAERQAAMYRNKIIAQYPPMLLSKIEIVELESQ